jgi:hypothetical protein
MGCAGSGYCKSNKTYKRRKSVLICRNGSIESNYYSMSPRYPSAAPRFYV